MAAQMLRWVQVNAAVETEVRSHDVELGTLDITAPKKKKKKWSAYANKSNYLRS